MPELRPAEPDPEPGTSAHIQSLEARVAALETTVAQLVTAIQQWSAALIAPSPAPPGTLPLSADPNETEPSVI